LKHIILFMPQEGGGEVSDLRLIMPMHIPDTFIRIA